MLWEVITLILLWDRIRALIDPEMLGKWIVWRGGDLHICDHRPMDADENRDTLARVFYAQVCYLQEKGESPIRAGGRVRKLWSQALVGTPAFNALPTLQTLPRIIQQDGFLSLYALGLPLSLAVLCTILKLLESPAPTDEKLPLPLDMGWNVHPFFDVDATPPGILPKLFARIRIRQDRLLLDKIAQDLSYVGRINDRGRRILLTLAILSHAAAYRELEGKRLWIPSFTDASTLIPYRCQQHLVGEGLKTVSLFPEDFQAPGIYLCQGTELWPSQPSVLGSILSNFAMHGSATAAYAHSWRVIHKHLQQLTVSGGPLPWVAGHSMGGALAVQVGLYAHTELERVYVFNPPMPNERDGFFYQRLAPEVQKKIQVVANLDDFAFWRIGSHVVGEVKIFLGKRRWRYYPVTKRDCLWLAPAALKFFLNVRHAFPAHQSVVGLKEQWVALPLSPEEIAQENAERVGRFDYLSFFPKLYDPLKVVVRGLHTWFSGKLHRRLLKNEILVLTLHEQDLLEAMNPGNQELLEDEIALLRRQRMELLRQLKKKYTQ